MDSYEGANNAVTNAMNAEYSEELLANLKSPVAIVGNATPKYEFGAIIDAYETVIRLNNYRIDGFEAKVGRKTTFRCLNAWHDIEHRTGVVEFSPFTAQSPESANLAAFNQANAQRVLAARQDMHPLIPETPNPSTGFTLVQLCLQQGLAVDLFGFDGFKTPHYWNANGQFSTTHKKGEIDYILKRPGVLLFGDTYPYEQLYNFCHENHSAYDENAGLNLFQRTGWKFSGLSVLEYGAGNGDLSHHLEKMGNRVTAVEVSRTAFERIQSTHKIHGGTLSLPFIQGPFDLFLSIDVLEHLVENDIKMVIRQAARLCRRVLVAISTRPSGLLGPNGENLHLTVQPVEWWQQLIAPYFKVRCMPGIGQGQYILEGERVTAAVPKPVVTTAPSKSYSLKPSYRSRDRIHYFEDNVTETTGVVWQPCVYPLAAEIANYFGCHRLIDVGCGHADKLVALHKHFQITGIDYGKNIEYCRRKYPFGDWLETDLEKPGDLGLDSALIDDSIIICSDVVEHVLDPSILVGKLRRLLDFAPALVISTPERDLTHGAQHNGPPPNPSHVREWNLAEFQAFMESEGLAVDYISVSPSNDQTFEHKTIVAVVSQPRLDAIRRYVNLWGKTPDPAKERAVYRQALKECHQTLVKRAIATKQRPAGAPAPEPRRQAAAAASVAGPADKLDPSVDTLLKVAEAAYAKGDLAEAKTVLIEAETLAPRSALVLQTLGVMAFLAGDFPVALDALQRAQIVHPDQPDILVKIAVAAVKLEKAELFECALGRALELNPDHPEALQVMGDLCLQQEHFAEAARYFHRLLQKQPDHVEWLLSLAFCLFQGKEYDAAATVYERVLRLAPGNAMAQDNLRIVRSKLAPPPAPVASPAAPAPKFAPISAPTAPVVAANPAVGTPEVSIIILTWNQLPFTRACLESLQKYTPEAHEVILVDNGSTDGTPDYLLSLAKENPHYTVILNRANRGFAAGNNQGLRIAKGKTVLMLNNDTVLTEGWLGRMLEVLERYPEVGVVGPVTNCISGPQMIANANYNGVDGLQEFAAQWGEQNEGKSVEITRVVGFCLLARREVIERIGGLDERFGSGNFEDDDFCIRALSAGYKARIARSSFIHHAGSQSFKGARIDYTASMRRNWELFKAKYQLPGDALIENGYRLPRPAWSQALHSPLPDLAQDHQFDAPARAWRDLSNAPAAEAPTATVPEPAAPLAVAPQPAETSLKLEIPDLPQAVAPAAGMGPIELPPTALVARLKGGYELMNKEDWLGAWKFGLHALKLRPFHPEAYVMLGQIAQSAGHIELARQCGERALQLTPHFDLAVDFMSALPAKGKKHKLNWPALPVARAGAAPSLTVCVIAKDEEKFISRCLTSIRSLAAQIVLVDTGSTDRTVEIAKELGAEVHYFKWNDNFSDARNAALEHARGDWVLCLDADEELPESEHPKMVEAISNPEAIACRVPLINCGLNEVGGSYVPRLFRNAPGLFFIGRVHEQVFPSVLARAGEWKLKIAIGGGEIRHHGYENSVMQERDKVGRNLKLLQQAVLEMPDEPNLVLNLGLELTRSGQPEEGLEKYRQAFRMMSDQDERLWVPELRESLLTQFPVHLMTAKRYEEIVQVLTSPLAVGPGLTSSMHYVLGGAYFQLKKYAQAAEQMEFCIAKRHEPVHWPLIREVLGVAPRRCQANSMILAGRPADAMKAFREAMTEDSNCRPLRQDFARFLHHEKESVEALNLLHGLVQEDSKDAVAWTLGGTIALSSPDYFEVAMEWTQEAIQNLPDNPDIQAQRAEFLLLGQEPQQALALWEKIPGWKLEIEVGKFICQLVTANITQLPASFAGKADLELSRDFVRWYRRFIMWQSVEIVNAINDRLPVLKQLMPMAEQVIASAVDASNKPGAEMNSVAAN